MAVSLPTSVAIPMRVLRRLFMTYARYHRIDVCMWPLDFLKNWPPRANVIGMESVFSGVATAPLWTATGPFIPPNGTDYFTRRRRIIPGPPDLAPAGRYPLRYSYVISRDDGHPTLTLLVPPAPPTLSHVASQSPPNQPPRKRQNLLAFVEVPPLPTPRSVSYAAGRPPHTSLGAPIGGRKGKSVVDAPAASITSASDARPPELTAHFLVACVGPDFTYFPACDLCRGTCRMKGTKATGGSVSLGACVDCNQKKKHCSLVDGVFHEGGVYVKFAGVSERDDRMAEARVVSAAASRAIYDKWGDGSLPTLLNSAQLQAARSRAKDAVFPLPRSVSRPVAPAVVSTGLPSASRPPRLPPASRAPPPSTSPPLTSLPPFSAPAGIHRTSSTSSSNYSLTPAEFEQLQKDMAASSRAYSAANQSILDAQGHLLVMKRSHDSITSLMERAGVASVASDDGVEEVDPPAVSSSRPRRSTRSKK